MVTPEVGLAAAAESELADLETVWETLDLPGHRVELIDGQIVVSPTARVWHSAVVDVLIDQLVAVKQRRGWRFHVYLTVHIEPTRERLIPDLMIAPPDAPQFGDAELLSGGVLLVAEVVSPSSRRQDREVKPRAYAQGRVPLYLVIDKLADPPAVTLHHDPGPDGYRDRQRATAGQPLRLPEPFGVALDTARLLG
jgi:Uma2 family endonuclease